MKIDSIITIYLKIFLFLLHIFFLIIVIPPLFICCILYFINIIYPMKIIQIFASLYWQLEFLFFLLHNRLEIKGLDKLNDKDNYIICANHICGMDFNIIHYIAHMKSSLHAVKYTLKYSLLFVPIFGIGMLFNGFCFLTRNFSKDEIKIKKYIEVFTKNKLKLWLVLFPEGTRFTLNKKLESDKFCKSNDLKQFKNTLFPRKRGFNLLSSSLRGYVKKIAIISIFYENSSSSLFQMLFGSPNLRTVFVNIDVIENVENVNVVDIFEKIDLNIEQMKLNSLEYKKLND